MRDLPDNINIFILHSKQDRDLKQELKNHLSLLERLGYVDVWHEDLIEAGENKKEKVSELLLKSHVILLLISANFFSPECYDEYAEEIRLAYDRQKRGEVKIIPVILKACDWQLDILASLNPLPKDGHPVSDKAYWDSSDKAFKEITVELRQMIGEIRKAWSEVKAKVEKSKKTIEDTISSTVLSEEIGSRFSREVSDISKEVSSKIRSLGEARLFPTSFINNSSEDSFNPVGQEDVAEKLLNTLLGLLMTSKQGDAVAEFRKIGHDSLFHDTAAYNSFLKNEFDKAVQRVELYIIPVKIISSKKSGRTGIRHNGLKEEGEEVIYTISKKQAIGSFQGSVRIFFPADNSSPKISKISL